MQNTMRAHSARQISMEGGVDVNKGHMVYTHCSICWRSSLCGDQVTVRPWKILLIGQQTNR